MGLLLKLKGAKKVFLTMGSIAAILATPLINRVVDDFYNRQQYDSDILMKIKYEDKRRDIVEELDPEDAEFYFLKSTYKKIKN